MSNLTEKQQVAYDFLDEFIGKHEGLATLQGYAGTGKTHLISQLVGRWAKKINIAIAAPTNKAVAVLASKVNNERIKSASIHSLLGLKLTELEEGGHKCVRNGDSSIHQFDLVLVDECSMISTELFKAILYSRRSAKIIFIGDSAQLPPVGESEISPTFTTVNCKTILTEVVRQAADNPIIKMSMVIRQAIEEHRRVTLNELAATLPIKGKAGIMQGNEDLIEQMALYVLQQEKKECRVIAFTNKQVQRYNRNIHFALYGQSKCVFSEGERVIANDEFKARKHRSIEPQRIINSEELTIESITFKGAHADYPNITCFELVLKRDTEELVTCYFPEFPEMYQHEIQNTWKRYRDEKFLLERTDRSDPKRYEKEQAVKGLSAKAWALTRAFAPIRHVYAMTSHKSQGSTFHTVIVDWKDLSRMQSDFAFNRALYVACTRASEHMLIAA